MRGGAPLRPATDRTPGPGSGPGRGPGSGSGHSPGSGSGSGSGAGVGRRRGFGSDQGSATVWSVGAIAVLCVVFGIVLALGQAVVARHRAAGGADLAALAAADHWAQGGTAACAGAERVARAQGARLVRCVLTRQVSDVKAASGRGPFAAEVRARAGPATEVPAVVGVRPVMPPPPPPPLPPLPPPLPPLSRPLPPTPPPRLPAAAP
ncbi:Rv3654c family TadE-like protein [Streptomyces sp. BBFR51]|uniref:Rv3654c family TadE-like protein n=1 Tax=Streptomyces sp. BBFR51 TaxID=3372856 RepID=UPI0037DDCBC9